jgi:prepilin-type processing-associated H-X9-DG protein
LPNLDQSPVFNLINFNDESTAPIGVDGNTTVSPGNLVARRTILTVMLCPSNPKTNLVTGQSGQGDSWGDGLDGGRGDYVGSMGWSFPGHRNCASNIPATMFPGVANSNLVIPDWSDPSVQDGKVCGANGVMGLYGCIRLKDISDGTSNTVAVFEDMHWTDKTKPGNVGPDEMWFGPWMVHALFMPINTDPNPNVPNPRYPGLNPVICDQMSSMHTGGAQALMADGSVQFLSENMNHFIRMALGTRDRGEVIGTAF